MQKFRVSYLVSYLIFGVMCWGTLSFANEPSSKMNPPEFKAGFLQECVKDEFTIDRLRYCAGTLAYIVLKYVNNPVENHDCESVKLRVQTLQEMKAEFELILNKDSALPISTNSERAKVYIEILQNDLKAQEENAKISCQNPS